MECTRDGNVPLVVVRTCMGNILVS